MARKTRKEREKHPFVIVGIGASAGGLTALESFFSHLPANSSKKMAFVLVLHLAQNDKSILSELLRKHTLLQICDAADGAVVEPGNIYIIPSNCNPEIRKGKIYLEKLGATRFVHLRIDSFLRSLALDQKERSICIILSGTGCDGALGLKAIKGEGGMAMVQDADSAEYKHMPCSAIATNLADYVLPPQEMPARLLTYVENDYIQGSALFRTFIREPSTMLKKILELLQLKTGHNFYGYKQTTLSRRIERRLAINQIEQLDEYISYLQQHPEEADALFRELLIGVTAFFRDPQAFEELQKKVIPFLFADKISGDPIRVWVPGCSTGEEAYSLAILLREHMCALQQPFKIQIFATDIDSEAIEKARSGIYPASIEVDISPDRIKRFFVRDPGGNTYTVQKKIREMLIFSEQNITSDPPFSRLDLISCRNMLIYMGGELQKKTLHLISYALNPGGFLFLGSSESVGDLIDYFSNIDRRWKIYQSKGAAPFHLALKSSLLFNAERTRQMIGMKKKECRTDLRELVEKKLLRQYTPACVVITKSGDILYIHGRTGKYLEPAQGEINLNILQMAREGLKTELIAVMRKAVSRKKAVTFQGLQVRSNGETSTINLTVSPLVEDGPEFSSLFLVIFEEVNLTEELAQLAKESSATGENITEKQISSLEKELKDKEEYLQIIIEELETSNEELQSTNEEFQSTNEELDTSREELHSVNEELVILNAELRAKIDELSRVNNDMSNMLAGTGVGTIFIDLQQRIQRYTPIATKVINLIPGDLGRPVSHLSHNLEGYDQMAKDIQEVLDTLVSKEVEVRTRSGIWYLMRILPYRTMDNVIEGVVISFVDITDLKSIQGLNHLAFVVRDSNDAITVQDLQGQILAWNPGAKRLYGWNEEEALSMNFHSIIPENKREEALEILKKLAFSESLKPLQSQRLRKNGKIIDIWMTASVLVNEEGKPYAIATTERAASEEMQSI